MTEIFVLLLYYFIILFSILGYGLFFLEIIKKKISLSNFGYVGLSGIYVLILYSYISNFVLAHSEIHNILLIFLGLIIFLYKLFKNFSIYKKEFIITILVFCLISSSLFLYKNHDDFTYYHFPYIYYLTQQSFYIGIGQFNLGFRTPSSIFYLNSLFYLPLAKFYLFHFGSIFILGFANIILLNNINNFFSYLKFKKNNINISNYLSLFTIIFINIFFYRIAEHGTDRSAQILIFLLIIELIIFINLKKIKSENLFKLYLLTALIISLKAFYLLYAIFFIPLLLFVKSKKQTYFHAAYFLFINKFFSLFLFMLFFTLFTYFINTGCIVYPVTFTCFDNFNWGLTKDEVIRMNNHYELWSKGGLTPNTAVSNPLEHIQNFNWVKNWIDLYFFNKVSDFILGLILTIFIVIGFFKRHFFTVKKNKINKFFYLIYLIIIILGLEWFYNHPALRYGGYCLIALLFFIPISVKLDIDNVDYKYYIRSVFILLIITVFAFNYRNVDRIVKEVNLYKYKPFRETFYNLNSDNFRLQKKMEEYISKYNECLNSIKNCDQNGQKISIKYGKIIFNNRVSD